MSHKQTPEYYPGSYYQPLFDFLQDQFDVLALDSEMADIIEIVRKMGALHPSESTGVPYQKCPKCDGQGKVLIPPHMPGDAATWSTSSITDYVCDVCNGAKVIPMYVAGSAGASAVWVKATNIKIKYNETYYAQRADDPSIKGTGWFQQSDGTFFWYESEFVPLLKNDQKMLLLLDESAAGSGKEEAYDDLYRLVYSNLAKLRARTQHADRMAHFHEDIKATIENITKQMQAMPQPDNSNFKPYFVQSESGKEEAVRLENIALKEYLWKLVRAVGRLLDDKYTEGDAAVRQELWTAMHITGDEAREYLEYINSKNK